MDIESPGSRSAIFVTGASSQIGRCVLRRLRAAGATAVAIGRKRPERFEDGAAQFIEIDLTNPELPIPYALSSVVHIADIWLLPPHIEALCERGARRLVCFSSTSIYAKQGTSSAAERRRVERIVEAESTIAQRCDTLGIGWTVLRPTLIYGLGVDRNVSRAARFIQRFKCYPLAFGAEGLRQPVHADDLAGAALTALRVPAAAGRHYDVGGGETLAYREMVGRIFDVLQLPRRCVRVPFLEYFAAAAGLLTRRPEVTGEMVRRMRSDLVCDNRPAADDLGYKPRRFLTGGKQDLVPDGVDTRIVA